jgi:hypothetical protein
MDKRQLISIMAATIYAARDGYLGSNAEKINRAVADAEQIYGEVEKSAPNYADPSRPKERR